MQCRHCQTDNPETNKFCGECGYQLTTLPGKADAGYDAEGERKHATVLFSDLSDYTALTTKLDPEEVQAILYRIFTGAGEIVERYAGTIWRFLGDEIMVLFGVPRAHEDDSVRAIHVACEIHDFVYALNPDFQKRSKISLQMHTGIDSGLVVTGEKSIGERRYGLTGETVNIAKRLTSLAKPGEILVGETTYLKATAGFSFETLDATWIKGKQDPIRVFKVLAKRDPTEMPRLEEKGRVYSEMVGRDAELDRLNLQLEKVINGFGSVVNIIGEPGIGKSRLYREFKNQARIKRVVLLEGKAISIGLNLAFHPVVDILKHWAHIGEDDSEVAALGKLEAAMRDICGEETNDILPFIATLIGLKLTSGYAARVKGIEDEALEKMILKSVRDLLTRSAEKTPLVIAIEDLHWADVSSLDLMGSLSRLAATRRILFINIFRPGHKGIGGQNLSTFKDQLPIEYVEILLEPLNANLSEQLIRNILKIGSFPHAGISKIVKRAGGNPFYIEEIVHALIDTGALVDRDGKFEVSSRLATMPIPQTISDVLSARLDLLNEYTRSLVKIASVIGRNFFFRVLKKVATGIVDIEGSLLTLTKLQIIQERKRLDELEYVFKHALVQETAYNSILHHQRRELHVKVARAIETVFQERLHEFYGLLALHYSKGKDYENAEYFLVKAGDEALKSSASYEALHYYQEVMELYLSEAHGRADSQKKALFEKNIAVALYNQGRYDEAIKYFNKALDFYWGRVPKFAFSKAYALINAFFHFLISVYWPALKFRRTASSKEIKALTLLYSKSKALSIIDPKSFFFESIIICKEVTKYKLKDFELGLMIFVASASLFSFTGISFHLSRKILTSACKKIDKEQVKIYIIYDFMETIHHYLAGNWHEIREYDLGIVEKNLNEGQIYLSSQHLYWHGCPLIYTGNFEKAHTVLLKLSHIAYEYENDFSILLNYLLKIKLLLECRQLDKALSVVDKGIAFAKDSGFSMTLLDFYSSRAKIQLLMGIPKAADKSIQLAAEINTKVRSTPIQQSIYLRSQIEFGLHQLEAARGAGALSEAGDIDNRVAKTCNRLLNITKKAAQHRTEALRLKGIYLWLKGQPRPALKWMKRAVEEGERLGARLELSRTFYEIGKRLSETRRINRLDGIAAADYLDKARELFIQMDLAWDLEKLSQLNR